MYADRVLAFAVLSKKTFLVVCGTASTVGLHVYNIGPIALVIGHFGLATDGV